MTVSNEIWKRKLETLGKACLLLFGAILLIGGVTAIFYAPQAFIGNMPAKVADPYPLRGAGIISTAFGIAFLGFDIYFLSRNHAFTKIKP